MSSFPGIPTPRRARAFLAVLLLVATVSPPAAAGEAAQEPSLDLETEIPQARRAALERGGEALPMRWKLSGFLGVLAGMFVPSRGDALLTFVPGKENRLEVELLVTAPKRESEYFLYGAEIDRGSGSTSRVWSSYSFRGKSKDREQVLEEAGIIDFASAIYHLRSDPPERTRRVKIWNGGRTYPADVEPLGLEKRKIDGKKVKLMGFLVRGVKLKGEPYFDDKFSVYFMPDDAFTPVEVIGRRGWVQVKFQLTGEALDGSAGEKKGAR